MGQDLRRLAREACDWMAARAPSVQAEVFVSAQEQRTLCHRRGEREAVETASQLGAGVRVVRDGRVGFASGGGADTGVLQALWERAVEQLAQAEEDPGRELPAPAAGGADAALAASLLDEPLDSVSWDELSERLRSCEAAAGAGGLVLRSELARSEGETVIASTRGVLTQERASLSTIQVSVTREASGQARIGEGYRVARRLRDLDGRQAAAEAVRRAEAGADARRVRAGRRAVILEPWVGAEFLELLSDLLSAEEVQGGRSLLAGRLGRSVASNLVTLRDAARMPAGAVSACFDDEGMPTRDQVMIEAGVLRAYFHDSATAAREAGADGGCGWRDSWRGLPAPGPSNLSLAAGATTREALLADTRDGLLLMEVLGTHMVDSVSGEFSVGVSGYEVEKGALVRPFQGAMLSGDLLEMFARVDAVASDLAFAGPFSAPTFRVAALDVA